MDQLTPKPNPEFAAVNWFSISGVSLDAKITNSTSDKLAIIPQGGHTTKICGSNDKPLYASKIKEVS